MKIKKQVLLLLLMVAGVLGLADHLAAQETQSPGQTPEGSLLPEIDPQDIEIRSHYSARFPGLRRQPILGFAPGSRVFQVDPDRTPFLEDLTEIAAQLPVGELGRPEAPPYRPFPYADSSIGYGRLGIGSYFSPKADLWLNHSLSEDHLLTGSFNHRSGGSHLDHSSSFRDLDLEGSWRGKLSESSVMGVTASVSSDFNHLPYIGSGTFEDDLDTGRKSYTGFQGETRFRRYSNRIEHLEIGVRASYDLIDLDEEIYALSGEQSDWRVGGDASYTWAGSNIDEIIMLSADLQAGGYSMSKEGGTPLASDPYLYSGLDSANWHLLGVGGTWQRLFNYRTRLHTTLAGYHASDVSSAKFYIAPRIQLDHYATDFLTFAASIEGKPEMTGAVEHHRENRFLLPYHHQRNSYNMKADVQVMLEPIANNQIRAGVSYLNSSRHPVFVRDGGGSSGHYRLTYESVTIPRAFAGIGVDLIRERLWFDVEAFYQNPRISDDQKLPYAGDFGLTGSISLRPASRLLFEAWGEFMGPRESPGGEDLGSYLNLGSRLEIKLTERIGAYGKLVNLLGQQYELFEGYPERPLQIYGGITFHL